jgi:hypothetical protein
MRWNHKLCSKRLNAFKISLLCAAILCHRDITKVHVLIQKIETFNKFHITQIFNKEICVTYLRCYVRYEALVVVSILILLSWNVIQDRYLPDHMASHPSTLILLEMLILNSVAPTGGGHKGSNAL